MGLLDSLHINPARLRLWLLNVGSSYVDMAVAGLSFFFLTPLLVHYLGLEAYAVWLLCHTIVFYLGFLDLGFGRAQVRYFAKFKAEGRTDLLNDLVATTLSALLLAGATAALIGLAFAFTPALRWIELSADTENALRGTLAILSVNLFLGFPAAALRNIYYGAERFDIAYSRSIVLRLVSMALQITLLTNGYGLLALATAEVIVTCLQLILDGVLAHRCVPQLRISVGFKPSMWHRIRPFALWASFDDVLAEGTAQLDRLVIAIFLPLTQLTPYVICKQVSSMAAMLIEPMTETFFPMAATLHTQRKREPLKGLLLAGTKLAIAVAAPIAIYLIFFGTAVVQIWIPDLHDELPRLLLPLIVINVCVSAFFWTSTTVLMALAHMRTVALLTLAEIVLGLVLILLATQHIGVTGIAVGALAANLLVGILVQMPLVCRTLQISIWALVAPTAGRITLACVLPTLVAIYLRRYFIPHDWLTVMWTASLVFATYFVALVTIGLSGAERRRYTAIAKSLGAASDDTSRASNSDLL